MAALFKCKLYILSELGAGRINFAGRSNAQVRSGPGPAGGGSSFSISLTMPMNDRKKRSI
jgi:hypothetical protein